VSPAGYIGRVLLTVTAIAVLLVLAILVWGLRPPLAHIEQPLAAGTAVVSLQRLAGLVAWAASLGYLLALVARAARTLADSPAPVRRARVARLDRLLNDTATTKHVQSPSRLTPVRPYPLVVRLTTGEREDEDPRSTLQAPSPQASPTTVTSSRSILLLGPLKIGGARQPGRRLRSLTAQLLVYLALNREGATVEKLADTLLPDTDLDRARNRLWQSATEARRTLGDAFRRDNDGRYQLDRAAIRIDVDELERLLADARQPGDATGELERLEQALGLFRGAPLADTDLPWADGRIRHLSAIYAELLERVGRLSLEASDPQRALQVAERGIQIDQLNESLWRLAMEADRAAGLRESVTQRYDNLRAVLHDQLGLEPAADTRALYHRLLGQEYDPVTQTKAV
jgi:DNA-binding SARP family transcriptional activator